MPKVQANPQHLRPLIFHGIDLQWKDGDRQATADCPWCGKEGKFSAAVETGLWKCWVCSEEGNPLTFVRKVWERSTCPGPDAVELAGNRGLLEAKTLEAWGLRVSFITGHWLLPAYGADGKLLQVYQYLPIAGKRKLLPTPELGSGYFRPEDWKDRPEVFICETWNALVLWELLQGVKLVDGQFSPTGNPALTVGSRCNLIGVPGAMSFSERWASLCAGKIVTLGFDSDHPREAGGKRVDGAGWAGMRRAARILAAAPEPPEEIRIVRWGPEGYDPQLKSGYDIRDLLTQGDELEVRTESLGTLYELVEPIPEDWVQGRTKAAQANGGTELECLRCKDWPTLQTAWRKAMKWTEGLDRALANMLAAVLSTGSVGSQLWMKIIGPPSCGKSTLCEAISVNRKHVKALSTIRGFHSGFKDGDGSENKSLILKIKGKTLVVKDADSLLTAPNKDQILGEARDLYDKTARSDYRNAMGMDHSGINMTLLLCGTAALRILDASELGARFLDCVIMEKIDDELEDEIAWRAANKAVRNTAMRSNCQADTQVDRDMLQAMQLTGGFIDHIQTNAEELLARVEPDEVHLRKIVSMAKFVAYMRARPSTKQDENVERELCPRLVEQHVRLAMCLAAVLGRPVDGEVMRRVRQTALDTARGRTLDLVRILADKGTLGAPLRELAERTQQSDVKESQMLNFLRRIGAVESFHCKQVVPARKHWRLTSKMAKLYKDVADAQG